MRAGREKYQLLPLSCSREAGRGRTTSCSPLWRQQVDSSNKGTSSGSGGTLKRSSETSVNGVVFEVNWNVLIDRDEEVILDVEYQRAVQEFNRLRNTT